MKAKKIYNYIKTECGQIKFENLSKDKSIFGKIRLYWFIIFAIIRDFNVKN